MTERGLPIADGASACPFVAFDDDRDERAAIPDHRHRCYAETPPAPRAIAHQEAYCLSSSFPVCPTFQDWARREAARARGGGRSRAADHRVAAMPAAEVTGAGRADDDGGDQDAGATDPIDVGAAGIAGVGGAGAAAGATSTGRSRTDDDELDADSGGSRPAPVLPGSEPDTVRRNPPRDWAAPPPWLASSEGPVGTDDAEPPPFLGRRGDPAAGLAGSAADRLAGGPPVGRRAREEEPWNDPASDEHRPAAALGAAGVAAGAAAASAAASRRSGSRTPAQSDIEAAWDEDVEGEAQPRRITRRPRAYDQHLGGPDGPDWERPRRYEAYPTIRTRVSMPQVPRLAGMAVVIALLAIALFFLPGLLNLGGGGGAQPGASSSTRPAASVASLAPTQPPAPTPVVYTLKKNDVLSKVAAKYGLTLDELLAANPDIKNPNKVAEGQQIIIPAPSAAAPDQVGRSAAPSGGGSPAP